MKSSLAILALIALGLSGCDDSGSSRTVTLGKKQGQYERMAPKKLASHMLDIAAEERKVEMDYTLADLDIEPNYGRLNLRPLSVGDAGVYGVDVLVRDASPLYDKIVDLNPPAIKTTVTVAGTAKRYENSFNSIYIDPDQITFSIRAQR